MVRHPEVVRHAQAELDRACPNRLPMFNDRPSLPFIDFIVWESLRWAPMAPQGLPRVADQDDIYNGYCIPKGTTIITNLWAMLRDEATYPEPDMYNPWRYMDAAANRAAGVNPLPEIAFGFGRRECAGRTIAFDTLWIVIASILKVYDIKPVTDAADKPILPKVEFTNSSLNYPFLHLYHFSTRYPMQLPVLLYSGCL
jgi:cytochrome P450